MAQVNVPVTDTTAVRVAERLGLGELVGAPRIEAVLGGTPVDGVEQVACACGAVSA